MTSHSSFAWPCCFINVLSGSCWSHAWNGMELERPVSYDTSTVDCFPFPVFFFVSSMYCLVFRVWQQNSLQAEWPAPPHLVLHLELAITLNYLCNILVCTYDIAMATLSWTLSRHHMNCLQNHAWPLKLSFPVACSLCPPSTVDAPPFPISQDTPFCCERAHIWMGNCVSWHNCDRRDFGGPGSVDGCTANVAVGVFAAWLHAAGCYH